MSIDSRLVTHPLKTYCSISRALALGSILLFALLVFSPCVATAEAEESLPGFSEWTGDLDGMEERRLIRILVPYSKTIYFLDMGQQLGTAVELGQALESWINKGRRKEVEKIRVTFVPVARERLLSALVEGVGDIAAGNLTITPERLKSVDFAAPFAVDVKEVLVTGPSASPVATLDDLAGSEIHVRPSSSYFEHLSALNAQRRQADKPEIIIRPIEEDFEDEDLLEMVNAGLLQWCIVDDFSARIWSEVLENIVVREDIAVSGGGEIAWAIRKSSPLLSARLSEFTRGHKVGTAFGNTLRKRYYKSDKIVRAANSEESLEKFRALFDLFEKHAAAYEFDALLLTAQGYQESRLDQSQRSPRGAVGIMQLLPSTAADKAVGIKGIGESADKNIEAGAKYLRHLTKTYVTDEQISPINRMLLTLAAYNAGPGNLRKFRRATVDMGLDQNVWFGNVENGAARIVGRETVQYVSNIYKYYFAYRAYVERQSAKSKAFDKAPE